METINIAIADDHEIVRDGIVAMLEDYEHIMVVGQAQNGEEIIALCEEMADGIDLIIMDLNMGVMDGIEATRNIKKRFPNIKILALTMIKDEEKIREVTRAGASGYILKNSGMEELVEAINQVMKGEIYFSDEAVYSVITGKKEGKKEAGETNLTERELEVLELICKEYTNAEIADKLYLSVRTIDAHRRNLLQKTGARNTAGLVRYAMKHNLLGN